MSAVVKTQSIIIIAVAALLFASCTRKETKSLPSYSQYEFVDQEGSSFKLASLKGTPLFVSFIFTRCPMPDMCPLTMRLNQRLYKEAKAANISLKYLVITIDPEFDTPAVLKEYAKRYSLNLQEFTLATGKEPVISNFASELANVIGFPSGTSISHNVKSALLNSNLEVIKEYKDNEWKPSEVIEMVKSLKVSE